MALMGELLKFVTKRVYTLINYFCEVLDLYKILVGYVHLRRLVYN